MQSIGELKHTFLSAEAEREGGLYPEILFILCNNFIYLVIMFVLRMVSDLFFHPFDNFIHAEILFLLYAFFICY